MVGLLAIAIVAVVLVVRQKKHGAAVLDEADVMESGKAGSFSSDGSSDGSSDQICGAVTAIEEDIDDSNGNVNDYDATLAAINTNLQHDRVLED